MPLFNTSAFAPLPESALTGKPAYFFGGKNVLLSDTIMQVTNVSITTNVATVIATIQAGNIPIVGAVPLYGAVSGTAAPTISIQGTTTSAGLFNVSQVAVTSISVVAATGVATIVFPLTGSNVGPIADNGKAIIQVYEIAESFSGNATSVAISVPANEPEAIGSKSITVDTTFPTLPTACTVTLYSSEVNSPSTSVAGTGGSDWTSMGVVATVVASAQTVGPLVTFATPAGKFFRVAISGVTASGTVICRVIV